MARFIRNDRLTDALMAQAFTAISVSPGARALYDAERARGTEYNPALRKVANRLVGILYGCLKTRTLYEEATAWSHHENQARRLTSKLLGCLSCPQSSIAPVHDPFQHADRELVALASPAERHGR